MKIPKKYTASSKEAIYCNQRRFFGVNFSLLKLILCNRCTQGSIILLLPPPQGGGGKKSAQGREFKVYKEMEGKKRKEKMERKERGEERKRKREKKRK